MHVSRAELLAIEQAAVRGWPALRSAEVQGWVWRSTSGGSVRANTVAALAFHGADAEAAIDEIERRYRTFGAAPRFTISEVSAPSDLDARLAARGYVRGGAHVTMARRVVARPTPDDAVRIGLRFTPEWLQIYLSGLTADRRDVAPRILEGLPGNRMYFGCRYAGRLAASGLSIADGELASVQCMATLAAAQRQGCAQHVLGAIESWAAESGCTLLYLQTDADNTPAQSLYLKYGFSVAGHYHTRVRTM